MKAWWREKRPAEGQQFTVSVILSRVRVLVQHQAG